SLHSSVDSVSRLLRKTSDKLLSVAADFERGGDRDRGHQHLARFTARRLYPHPFSGGGILLRLAARAWVVSSGSAGGLANDPVRKFAAETCAREFRRHKAPDRHGAGSAFQSKHR